MKKVAVIQDLSSFGKCSLTAAIPVLSVMGVQACPLPTAVLSAQTEYPSYFLEDFTSKMKYFIEEWTKLQVTFDGIMTGFVASGEQIKNIFQFLEKFRTENTMLLVDPVMGDDGEVYDVFTGELLKQMKELTKHADVITPNVTECCLLSGMNYEKLSSYSNEKDYMKAVEEAGKHLHEITAAKVIITGVNPPVKEPEQSFVGNMYLDENHIFNQKIAYNGKSYSGTGDLFSSVMMGGLISGYTVKKSIELAVAFLTRAIHDASKAEVPEIEGVHFEKHLRMLLG